MSGSNARRRQKKLEKHKKKRAEVQRNARRQALQLTGASLLQKARTGAFGPSWISAAIDKQAGEDEVPALITVIVTRRVAGLLLPQVILVDRTCLGVKNATLLKLATEADLDDYIAWIEERGNDLRPCEALLAQSVVFHAVDYARTLGFSPHRDFRSALLEPRPETLLETPLATPDRPFYIAGPRDDVRRITAQLNDRVGAAAYRLVIASDGFLASAFDDEDWDDAFDDFDDFDVDDFDDDDSDEPSTVEVEGTPITDGKEEQR